MSFRIRRLWPPFVALVVFLGLLFAVLAGTGPVRRLDQDISGQFREYGSANPDTIAFVRIVTDVMGTYAFLAIGVAATILLWHGRRRDGQRWDGQLRRVLFCGAVTVVIPTLWSLMHALLHRPRPTAGFVDIESNGFPSGHTSHATATAIVAVLLLWPRLRRGGRVVAVAVGALFAGAIGLTRVVLLAHWPTDVLGGWLLGAAVVPMLAWVFRPVSRTQGPVDVAAGRRSYPGD